MSIGTTTAGSAVSAGPAPARKRTRGWRGPLFIAAFVAPAALIVYVTLVLLPVALVAVYSFFNWNGLGALERFIGFDNYARALTGSRVPQCDQPQPGHRRPLLVIQGPSAILIALLLNRPLRGRTLISHPHLRALRAQRGRRRRAPSGSYPLSPPNGPFDGILTALGWAGDKPNWLADPAIAFWTLFVVLTWKYLGFAIILMLAGLQGVPEELGEACGD